MIELGRLSRPDKMDFPTFPRCYAYRIRMFINFRYSRLFVQIVPLSALQNPNCPFEARCYLEMLPKDVCRRQGDVFPKR